MPACMNALADVPEPVMESSCSFDFVPLLTALKTAEFREADQLTRDALIKLAGDAAVRRGYVYFTEVPKLPKEDLGTIDRLWRTYSGDKFGYSVQAEIFESKKVSGNFDRFFERIGWTKEGGNLLRWLPEAANDEFVYDVDKAGEMGEGVSSQTLRGFEWFSSGCLSECCRSPLLLLSPSMARPRPSAALSAPRRRWTWMA